MMRTKSVFKNNKLAVAAFRRAGVLTAALVVMFSLSTCDTITPGLGEKVDIYAPRLEIQSPSANTYVKGTITLKGVASDDIKLAGDKIVASYPTADGSTATVDVPVASGAWSLDIASGSGGSGLPEGDVTVTLTATDDGGKTTTATLLVKVDNLPPTVLLNTPTTYLVNKTQWVDSIDIKGEAYDNSPIAKVTVSLLREDNSQLASAVADGTNSWSVRFSLKDTANGPLTIADDGKLYRIKVVAEDAGGMASDHYFHRKNITYTSTLFPSVNELGRLEAAAGGTSASGVSWSQMSATRLGAGSAMNPPYADFKFTYEKLPTITYSNIDATKTASENLLSPGSLITGTITPPEDMGAIITDAVNDAANAVKVRLLRANPADPANPTELIVLQDTSPASLDTDSIELVPAGNSISFKVKTNGSHGTLEANKLPPGEYRIEVSAKSDQSSKVTVGADFFIDSAAPYFTETTVDTGAKFRSAAFAFGGEAAAAIGLDQVTIKENGVALGAKTQTFPGNPTSNQTWSISGLPSTGTDGTYDYELTVLTTSGKTSTIYRTVNFDTTVPSAEVTSFAPVAVEGSPDTVNGSVNVAVLAGDNFVVDKAEWNIDGGAWTTLTGSASSGAVSEIAGSKVSGPRLSINTTLLTDDADHTLNLRFTDKAGNQTSIAKTFHIDQGTDNPVIDITQSLNPAVILQTNAAQNSLGVGAVIAGTVSDDDAVKTVTLVIKDKDGTTVYSGAPSTLNGTVSSRSRSFSHPVPATNGPFSVQVIAADPYSLSTSTSQTPVVWYMYDNADPELIVTQGNATDTAVGNTLFAFSGTLTDTNATAAPTLSVSINGGAAVPITVTAGAWNWTLPAGADGLKTIAFTAKDAANRTSTVSRKYLLDTAAPRAPVISAFASQYFDTILSAEGTADKRADGDTSSDPVTDLAAVECSIDNSTWVAVTGTEAWSKSITPLPGIEGSKTFYVRSRDKAGNQSAVATASYVIDRNNPVVASISGVANSDYKPAGSFTVTINVTDTLSLDDSASPTNAPLTVTLTEQGEGSPVDANLGSLTRTVNGTTSQTWTIPVNVTGDGTFTLTFSSKDKVGRDAIPVTREFIVDRTPPNVTAITNLPDDNAGTTTVYEDLLTASSYAVQGTAADNAGGSGIDKVQFSISEDGGSTWGSWQDASGTTTFTASLSSLTEQLDYAVRFQVIDKAGNTTLVGDQFKKFFKVDFAAPTLDEDAIASAVLQYRNSAVTIADTNASVATTDANGIKSVVVSYLKDGTISGTLLTDTSGASTWTASLPVNAATHADDGNYVITITATDKALRTTAITRNVLVDTQVPSLSLSNLPADDAGTLTVYEDLITSTSYLVQGTATETGGGSGLKRVQYALSSDSGASWGAWQDALGTGSYSVNLTSLTDSLLRAIRLRVEDNAGNVTASGDYIVRNFKVDLAPPILDEDAIASTALQYRNSAVSIGDLNATAATSDGNGIKSVVVGYLKDGTTSNTLLNDTSGASTWTTSLPVNAGTHTDDGNYEITITATDNALRTTTLRRSVLVDTQSPVLTVSSPSTNEKKNAASMGLAGTVADPQGGRGVQSIEYSFDSTNGINGTWSPISYAGLNWSVASAAIPGAEGSKSLWVRASDSINPATAVTVPFSYDLNPPNLQETDSGYSAAQATSTSVVAFGGSLTDTNLSAAPTLEVSVDGGSSTPITVAAGSWDWTMPAGDGLHTIVFTATDAAGRTSTVTRTILLDTINPSGAIADFASGYYADSQLAISGTASDAGSGVALVEYGLDKTNDGNPDFWGAVTGTTTWYKSDISLTGVTESSTAKVWIRVTDAAGRQTVVGPKTFALDRSAPSLGVNAAYDGIVFKNGGFTIIGTVSDGNTLGADPVSVSAVLVGTGAHTLSAAVTYPVAGEWSQVVNVAGSGTYELTITATDAVGRTTVAKRSVTVDTTAPTLEIGSVSPMLDGAKVNGKISISLNASDANGLQGVKYFFVKDGSTPTYASAVTSPTSALLASAPYTATVDTTNVAFTDATAYTLWAIARDKAGNDTVVSTTINLDQSSDLPQGSIDTPADGLQIGMDKKVRGTFSDDDGVANGGVILYVKKSTAGSYTAKPISLVGGAGQTISWNIDVADVLAAGDGTYQMYLQVGDDATKKNGLGQQTYTSAPVRTFTWDINPPTVSIPAASPVKTAYKQGDVITFSWTATDASGLGVQTVDVDGSSTDLGAISGSGPYTVTYTVPAGTSGNRILTLVVPDGTGRSATRSATFLVDTDVPVVDGAFTLNPGFIGFTPNGQFDLRGTASDNRGLNKVQVQLSGPDGNDGSAWTDAALTNGVWSYTVSSAGYVAASGTLTAKVRAIDDAGNISLVQTFTQSVDQAADKPTVAVISPVNGTTYGSTVQISGTAADDDGLADANDDSVIDTNAIAIEYWNTATPASKTTVNPSITGAGRNATWNYSLTGLAGGTYAVHVRAIDDNAVPVTGDWSTDTTFTVDTGVPTLVVDANAAFTGQSFTNNAAIVLTGMAEDSGGLKYVRARINGGSWVLATAAGMTSNGNVSDPQWTALASGTVSWTISLNLGSDGLKTIEFASADNNDLMATLQRSTTLDATAPAGAFDSQFRDNPTGSLLSTTVLNKVVRITGTVTENNLRDTDPIELRINGGSWTPVTGTFVWSQVWDTTGLADGNYTLELRLTDKAGNVTSSISKTVTTSQSADNPTITQAFVSAPIAADAGNNVLGTLLKVSGTISDDDGFNANSVSILLDGSATPITASNAAGTSVSWDYTWGALAQGQHYLTIQATDRNGLTRSLGPTYFLVDTANPALAVTTPTAGAKIKAGTLTISGTANDSGGFGSTPLTITLRHTDITSSLHNQSYTPSLAGADFTQNVTIDSAVKDGTLFIDFVLSDRAGKQSTLTRAVTIDTTAPVLNLNYPSSAAYINGLVSVTGTADDLNGLADVTMELLDPANLNLVKATINRSGSTLSSWEFPFNSFSYASATYALDPNAGGDPADDGKLWKVWFKLKATDNSGNVTELKTGPGALDYPYLFIDTDGDKPTISVTQPKNGDKIGGFVNMFGTATDDDGPVMQVEVQIDFNGDGDFLDSRDLDNSDSDANPATGIQLGANQNILGTTVKVGDPAHKWEDESAWYVVNATNNSWTQELNSSGELYASNTGGSGDVTIRVRSRDMFGLASEISSRTITLDQTFPRIENIMPQDQSYQNGSFLLNAEFGDNIDLNLGSLSQIKVNINKTGYQTLAAGANSGTGWTANLTADLGGSQHGYDLALTINTSSYFSNSSGILYVDLYVKDESNYTNQRSFTFYVDNQVPTGGWSTRVGAPDGLGIRNGQVNINGTASRAFIEGDYLDSGSVSGIDRIEVYFIKGGQLARIKGATGTMAAATAESVTVDTYNEGTSTWSGAPESLPFETFQNHRDTVTAGSFVVGRTYTIKTLGTDFTAIGASANTVGLKFTATAAGTGTGTAYDEVSNDYILKVDRPTEMSSISTGSDVDGDGVHEFMGIDGGAQRWRAYFDSTKLPDGLIDVHYVVYDLAGNRYHGVRRGFISNYGPQIDRIKIGSDYNGTGTVADVAGAVTEILDYYHPDGSVDRYASSSPIKVKNGKLYFNVLSSDPNGTNQGIASTVVNIVAPSPGSRGLLTSFSGASGGSVANDSANPISITVGSAQFPSVGDYTLEIVVKDNDNIITKRTAVITVLNTVDTTKPIVTPAALSQASSLETNDNGTIDDTSDDWKTGHLELQGENTVPAWTTISAAYGSDNDPKVSGTVLIKGTVSDDGRISNVNLTVDGVGTNVAVASWDSVTGKLVSTDPKFVISTQNLDENGHTLTYSYAWDSAGIPTITGFDKTFAVQAKDSATVQNVSDPHAAMRFDVVPFVRKLARDSMYNTLRSRYGRYLAHRGEVIQLSGFNLYRTTADTVSFGGVSVNLPASTSSLVSVTLPDTAKSGPMTLVVNGVTAINNLNDNTKAWNKEASLVPSIDGSTYWTDDRELHVWQSNDTQAGDDRGYFTGSIDPEYPAMSFDPVNRVLYASWSNYASSSVYYGVNNGAATEFFNSYDPSKDTDVSYGSRVAVVWNADTYGNGAWSSTGAGGVYVYDANANAALDSNWGSAYESELLYHDQKLMQFVNQRIATRGNNIHISYFDTDTKALKYWYAASGGNPAYAQTWINIDGGADEHDGTVTNLTSTKTTTNVVYVSSATPVTRLSNRTGTIASLQTALLNTSVAANTTIAATGTQNISAGTAGVLTQFLVSVGATVTSGTTPVAYIQPDTTVQTVHRVVGDYVSVGTPLVTMANGTVVTSTTAGYVVSIAAANSAAVHNSTSVATIAPVYVASIQKTTGATVAIGDTILTLSDSSTITATAAGILTFVAPVNTYVTTATPMATSISTARIVGGSRAASAGEFSAIDIMPTSNYPVIAYYDISNQTIKLARANSATPTAGTNWAIQSVMSAGDTNYRFSGKYVSMKIDTSGYVHLAFYRNSTGDLIYMKSTNNPTDGSAYTFGASVIIDSIGSVGIWADLSLNGTAPYISYLDSSLANTFDGIKMAYYDTTLERLTGDVAGQPDTVDGWETMNAPLSYEVESARTSIEYDTSVGGGFWSAAIGYSSTDYYRIAYYVKQ